MAENYWMLVSSAENFETSRERGFDLAAMKSRHSKKAADVRPATRWCTTSRARWPRRRRRGGGRGDVRRVADLDKHEGRRTVSAPLSREDRGGRRARRVPARRRPRSRQCSIPSVAVRSPAARLPRNVHRLPRRTTS
ncbi:MAG: hypothetical protein WKH64_05875 [Chloroflexia bacterium]